MIGLDTNILVRYLVQDDPAQGRAARAMIERNAKGPGSFFINVIVLCELVWVLDAAYAYPKVGIVNILETILRTAEFEIERREEAWAAWSDYRASRANFADCLLGRINQTHGCIQTATFDKGLRDNSLFHVVGSA